MMIAEESTSWPKVTESVKKDGLGFDYKWNMGWMNDFLGYMEYDPVFRGAHHNELTFSMVYAYSERFLLGLSHDEFVHEKKSLIEKMPGDDEQKFSNMRAALTYMVCHPGKKTAVHGSGFCADTGMVRKADSLTGILWKNRSTGNFMSSSKRC